MKYCANCNHLMNDSDQFCPACGTRVDPSNGTQATHPQGPAGGVFDKINDYLGNDGDRSLNWRMLFTDVFKKHTKAEAEEIFICGTRTTTPSLCDISSQWPHPWFYSRVLLCFVIVYALLWMMLFTFGNNLSIPGLVIIGAFAIPVAVMILFFEVNVYKNISFLDTMVFFMVGGCAAMLITQPMFSLVGDMPSLENGGAFIVGIIEELAKALIAFYFMKKIGCRYILAAMLVGAAVGSGFDAFETAGYALTRTSTLDNMVSQIYMRGFLAPGGHMIWAAMSAAGIVFAYKTVGTYKIDLLWNARFLRIFAIPVVLHTLWDMQLIDNILYLIALVIIGWIVCLLLVNMGLSEAGKVSSQACDSDTTAIHPANHPANHPTNYPTDYTVEHHTDSPLA